MAKVPVTQYNRTGVQTIGRYNPMLPGELSLAKARTATAITGAVATVSDIVERSQANSAATVSSELTEQMSELNEKVKSKRSYTSDELDDIGIEYNDTEIKLDSNGNEVETFRDNIPAYEVAEQVYKAQAERFKDVAMSNVSGKGNQVVENTFAQLYKQGIGDAINHNIKHYQDAQRLRMDAAYNQAVKRGNEDGAKLIAQTAVDNGVWSASEYTSKVEKLPNLVAQNVYIRAIDSAQTKDDLSAIKQLTLADSRFEESTRRTMYKMVDAKQSEIEKKLEVKQKEEFTNSSANMVVMVTNNLIKNKQPIEPEAIQAMALTPTDKKLVNTLNNNMFKESDPNTVKGLTVMVKTLGLPAGKANFAQRRASAVDQLLKAVEDNKLGVQDFSTLWDGINKAQAFSYESPDNEVMLEMIWRTLTGGSRDILSDALSEGGVHVQAAINAELKFRDAIRTQGEGFDAYQWWDGNKKEYLLQSTKDNQDEMQNQINLGYAVENDKGAVDLQATVLNLRQKVKDNKLTEARAEQIYGQISTYKKNIDRAIEASNKGGSFGIDQ